MGRRKASEVDNQKEKREDLLEHLYQIYRQGEELTVAEYATEKGFSMRETNALVRELKLSGYVEEEKNRKTDSDRIRKNGRHGLPRTT